MFQRVKNNYRVVVVCKNGDIEATYTFVESYDDNWDEMAESRFYEEFGIRPMEMKLLSREKI